ncbi:molecular chaperone HtpG [Dongia sedimenti]|uniref:Chaperone protein HtpG n=1 Tax=Dongia sedimenti TaxID=3064282 RepID=A0ABU0YLC2_9PROT|nr:molecular chaperone HtpG [Rhodospirillaceae bacterium R-7]
MVAERHGFQAEVSRLLDIVAHSLYSDKSVFLRELISNASDACDRLRYLSLTQSGLLGDDPDLAVTITIDKPNRLLTIADNGIGMSHDELIANLGTIARSGSAQFMSELATEESAEKKVSLIGQFGVGFYSAFMVSDKVAVTSRRAGDDKAWTWESEGRGEFTVTPAEKTSRGTEIALHIKSGEDQWLDSANVAKVVAKYSDHIALPVRLLDGTSQKHVNQAAALWTRSKSEITPEQYTEFYHHIAHAFDAPWATLHFKAEGKIDYTGLIFIPSSKPFDLFHPDRKQSLKLYVKRVFITDHCEDLLPGWLRFLKGIVDSEDLPLNISRETLQANPLIAKIRAGLIKRVLSELGKIAENEPERYLKFWETFGAVLKEGIYEDEANRAALLKLARFRSTTSEAPVSLAEYIGRMKDGQNGIYTISGDEIEALQRSPHLEGFRKKGVEVLLLTDAVDEFWMQAVGEYEGKPFKSATRGAADLAAVKPAEGAKDEKPEPKAEGIDNLIALMRLTLKDAVKDVRISDRLTDSACCLVAAEGDLDIHLEKLLRQHKKLEAGLPRVLEINGTHPMIASLAQAVSKGANEALSDACFLLLDQARIQDGEPLPDPAAFARRMNAFLQRGL